MSDCSTVTQCYTVQCRTATRSHGVTKGNVAFQHGHTVLQGAMSDCNTVTRCYKGQCRTATRSHGVTRGNVGLQHGHTVLQGAMSPCNLQWFQKIDTIVAKSELSFTFCNRCKPKSCNIICGEDMPQSTCNLSPLRKENCIV